MTKVKREKTFADFDKPQKYSRLISVALLLYSKTMA